MKIIYILDKPNLYGSERHVLSLLKSFNLTYDLQVVLYDHGPLIEKLDFYEIKYTIIQQSWFPTINTLTIYKFFRNEKPDIIHAHQPKALFWSSIVAKILNIPCIITIHSLPSNNKQSYKNPLAKMIVGGFHYLIKFISESLSSKIVYLSHFSFNDSLFKSKSVVIPNWIENVSTSPVNKTGFHMPLRLISIGSVSYNKGMDRLIDCLILAKEYDWTLKILGDGDPQYKQYLVDRCLSHNILERVEFVGYVDNINTFISDSDIFILLSRGETFGLAYIEAMNYGLPIIAWDIPIVKEIIPSGNFVLKTKEDILTFFKTIVDSPETYYKQSFINRDFVSKNFLFEDILMIYRDLYDKILPDNTN